MSELAEPSFGPASIPEVLEAAACLRDTADYLYSQAAEGEGTWIEDDFTQPPEPSSEVKDLRSRHEEAFNKAGLMIEDHRHQIVVGGKKHDITRIEPLTLGLLNPDRFREFFIGLYLDDDYETVFKEMGRTVLDNMADQLEYLERLESEIYQGDQSKSPAIEDAANLRELIEKDFTIIQPAYEHHDLTDFTSYERLQKIC